MQKKLFSQVALVEAVVAVIMCDVCKSKIHLYKKIVKGLTGVI